MGKSELATDVESTFPDDEGQPFSFNLTELETIVSRQIGKPCHLRKLAEGGYHKVLPHQICSGPFADIII